MNVLIINKKQVADDTLDDLAKDLPVIISEALEVRGGNMAILKPEQVSLEFSPASARDVGADIRIMVFARSNDPRVSTENSRATAILERVKGIIRKSGGEYSVDVRLYLMEIGAAIHTPGH
jgi:hypothetical protein